eukprot:TRINITY_DN11402_c0_g1_i4.p1 TRINITY_DN11402_c0_g1~~TRINITY_DN11402_c0_g1_i4.p1  ORF type:complete len:358 (-),score=119.75 TRINITY_DN11402_c0_g1_i4:400-1473(-)
MIRRPPRSTLSSSSAASDVYKRQYQRRVRAQALMAAFHVKQFEKSRSYRQDNNGWLQVVGGCGLLGVGMAVSGSGPTMLPTQLGSGVSTAASVFLGGLAGGTLYAVLEKALSFRTSCPKRCDKERLVIDDYFTTPENSSNPKVIAALYQRFAVPMGIAMILGALFFDRIAPHSADAISLGLPPHAQGSQASSELMRTIQAILFHPIAAGVVLGINQIPLRVVSDDGQGGSTSIMNIISFLSGGYLSERHFIRSWKQASQILYVYGGTLLGGLYGFNQILSLTGADAATVRQAALGDVTWTPARTFLGGLMMVFGARVAGGCTCGHGISGVSELSLQSFAGAAAIFGGGIAITLLLRL